MRYSQGSTNTEHIQTWIALHSTTLCDITIHIDAHRADWFSCRAFVLPQYTPARPPNLIVQITCGWPQISLSKVAGCAPLH